MNHRVAYLSEAEVEPEVLSQARRVLETVGAQYNIAFDVVEGDIGGIAIARHDKPLPEPTIQLCQSAHVVLLGAVGDRKYDSLPSAKKPERGLLELRTL